VKDYLLCSWSSLW